MPHVVETHRRLVVHSPMRRGMRVALGAFSLFPLLAPYELIFSQRWESYFNPFFLFFAAISLGALSVSAFFAWAAIGGISSTMTFNKANKTFRFMAEAPAIRTRKHVHPLASVQSSAIETHESSDGGPSYSLVIELEPELRYKTSSSWSLAEVREVKEQVDAFLAA